MNKRKVLRVFFIFAIFFFLLTIFFKWNSEKEIIDKELKVEEEIQESNIIKDVSYISKDSNGNEYRLEASEGIIDQKENNFISLTNVKGVINLIDYNLIEISSDFGKYNINNYDTIFSKNVIITYLDNKISGEYLDFSLKRNSMIISRKVVYTNLENILKADVIEINVTTKDTKIFMYKDNQKVNIKSID